MHLPSLAAELEAIDTGRSPLPPATSDDPTDLPPAASSEAMPAAPAAEQTGTEADREPLSTEALAADASAAEQTGTSADAEPLALDAPTDAEAVSAAPTDADREPETPDAAAADPEPASESVSAAPAAEQTGTAADREPLADDDVPAPSPTAVEPAVAAPASDGDEPAAVEQPELPLEAAAAPAEEPMATPDAAAEPSPAAEAAAPEAGLNTAAVSTDADAAEPAGGQADEAAAPEQPTGGFTGLGLRPELIDALDYDEPSPIQREAIPPLVQGRDLLGQAATGTGKTAAFALPVLEQLADLDRETRKRPTTLVLAPTRELAVQVAKAFSAYGKPVGARVVAVYGGQSMRPQLAALARGIDVVVATPGRALDLITRGHLHVAALRTVVLDEADEMLDMGFQEDLEAILAAAPAERQTVLFSATLPSRIARIAKTHLTDPVRLQMADEQPAPGEERLIREAAYVVAAEHLVPALARILALEAPEAGILFCHTRDEVEKIAEQLSARGHRAEPLHGGLTQDQRDRAMGRLRTGATTLLVATDVAARGLDVSHLTHVVNVGVPKQPEAYVHRIGRVGRAGREGVALTIADPRGMRRLRDVSRLTRREVPIVDVPQPEDLATARRAKLREAITAADGTAFRALVEELVAAGQDPVDLAAAAMALVDAARGTDAPDTADIPRSALRGRREANPRDRHTGPRGRDTHTGPGRDGAKKPWEDRRPRGGEDRPERRGPRADPQKGPSGALTNVFVGMGAEHKLRPQDLVGAICGETSLEGGDIGSIRVSERFSLVAVPTARADEVIRGLQGTRIKGRKATVRRERF